MSNTFAVTIPVILSGPVANAGTFTYPYPTGETVASQWDTSGHVLADDRGNIYTTGFTVSFGASAITVTNSSLGTLAAGRQFRLQARLTHIQGLIDLGITASSAEINRLDGVTPGTVAASKALIADASGRLEAIAVDSLNMASGTPTTHAINLEGTTLAASTNAIRGASVNPTRASGWISFSGTISTAPAQTYTDYRELHTTGTAEVLGFGSFPYMDSGASCASMFAGQDIAYASTGSTVLTAGGAVGVGVFSRFGKVVIDGATFNSGAVAAGQFLSFQANGTDVQAGDTSIANWEVASGGIQNIIKFACSAAKGATYFANFTDDNGEPVSLTNTGTLNDISAVANAGWIRVKVGSADRYLPLYELKA